KLSREATHERLSGPSGSELATLPDKLFLTPTEVAASLGSTVSAKAELGCLVFPAFKLRQEIAAVTPAAPDEAERLMRAQCVTPDDEQHYPDWLELRHSAREDPADIARQTIHQIAQ